MAPPLFHSFLQKGISNRGKLDTIYFTSNEKVVAPYGKLFQGELTSFLLRQFKIVIDLLSIN